MKTDAKKSVRLFLALAVMLTLFLCPSEKVSAANRILALNGQWVTGSISDKEAVDYYTFTVSRASYVTIDYQGWSLCDSYVQIWNADLTERYTHDSVYGCSASNPKTVTNELILEAGSYCVKVYPNPFASQLGEYRLRGSCRAVGNTETEPNNDFAQAMELKAGTKVTGLLSQTDHVDFFKLKVSSTRKVEVVFTSRASSFYFSVWDSDFKQIKGQYAYGSETQPATITYEEALSPGTYYIKVNSYSDSYTGRYHLSWNLKRETLSDVNVSVGNAYYYQGSAVKPAVKVVHNGITLKAGTDYTVSYKNNSKVGIASVTVTGKGAYQGTVTREYTITLKKGYSFQKGSYTYKITAASGSSGSVQLTKAKSTVARASVPATVSYAGATLKVTSVGSKAFANNSRLTKVSVGKNVTSISSKAFYGCRKLTTVSGCAKVSTIGTSAFYNCTKLKTVGSAGGAVTLGKVKTIGDNAFYGCRTLKKVNLTSTVLTKIGASAFCNCKALTSFTAKSAKLSSIGKKAFYGDSKLGTITLKTSKLTKSNVGASAFKGIKSSCRFKVPAKKVSAYKTVFRAKGATSKIKVTKL